MSIVKYHESHYVGVLDMYDLTSTLFPISFQSIQQEQIVLQNTYSCLSNNTNKSINCVRM